MLICAAVSSLTFGLQQVCDDCRAGLERLEVSVYEC